MWFFFKEKKKLFKILKVLLFLLPQALKKLSEWVGPCPLIFLSSKWGVKNVTKLPARVIRWKEKKKERKKKEKRKKRKKRKTKNKKILPETRSREISANSGLWRVRLLRGHFDVVLLASGGASSSLENLPWEKTPSFWGWSWRWTKYRGVPEASWRPSVLPLAREPDLPGAANLAAFTLLHSCVET